MTTPLRTEINTPRIASRIHAAAWKKGWRKFTLHYEHGQWFLQHANGAQYSVVDAEGGTAIDGFDFEQLTNADTD